MDKSKVVPDPGIYEVMKPIVDESRNFTLGHKPEVLRTEQFKAQCLRRSIDKLPLRMRRDKID